jgi:serine protease Do
MREQGAPTERLAPLAGRSGWMLVFHLLALLLLGNPLRADRTAPLDRDLASARQGLEQLSHAFRAAYQQVQPAVVLITTTRQGTSVRGLLPPFHPSLPEDEEFGGLGSGVVVSPDGYILSNYHVIEAADSILVTLADRRTFAAAVVGFDPLIDIALLKIDAADLPAVQLGDADDLQIGDWVLAIGHPLGKGITLTQGIVGALGRQAQIIEDEYGIESFIQTDAAINMGNSGGPLLNLRGEVVGINTALSTPTGYYIGYGLAVPINLAQEAMDDILVHGRVVRGYLGVRMGEVNQERIRALGLDLERPQGVYIEAVESASPAARGGLLDGDIILAVDGHPVDRANQVQTLIYGLDPGEQVELAVLRGSVRRQLEVVLGEREEDRLLALGQERLARLGLVVEALSGERARALGFTAKMAEELGFEPGEKGIVIVRVEPDGPAADLGIEVDDVITDIDQQQITSMPQLTRLLSGLQVGESALFWLWRPGQGIDMRVLEIPE